MTHLRPCLGKGASRRAGVGWVRRLAFLSILRMQVSREGQTTEVLSAKLCVIRNQLSTQNFGSRIARASREEGEPS